jgi:hypothetical protein
MKPNIIEHASPIPAGGIRVWTVGGVQFDGDSFVYDTTGEVLTLTTSAGETITIDVSLIVAFSMRPPAVTPGA